MLPFPILPSKIYWHFVQTRPLQGMKYAYYGHLGIDTKKFNAHHTKADWERVKKTYNLPATYFLTLGTVEPRKNGLHIIKSFNHFVQKLA